jgi:hypothetical protein
MHRSKMWRWRLATGSGIDLGIEGGGGWSLETGVSEGKERARARLKNQYARPAMQCIRESRVP